MRLEENCRLQLCDGKIFVVSCGRTFFYSRNRSGKYRKGFEQIIWKKSLQVQMESEIYGLLKISAVLKKQILLWCITAFHFIIKL